MVRRYKMLLGQKRKRRKSNCVQQVNEIPPVIVEKEEEEKVEDGINKPETASMKNSEKVEEAKSREIEFGFPIIAQLGNNSVNKPSVIFVIERASLEIAKVGKKEELLDGSKHAKFLRRNGRNPADYRPDIVFSAIIGILDSSLNKHGLLKALYVKTEKGDLIEIKPHVRIPRTPDRLAGLMLQLLQTRSISAVGMREKLLTIIENPVTQYLPADSLKIGFSHSADKRFNIQKYVSRINNEKPLVFVVGAMAHGKIDANYCDESISIDIFPLSASTCVNKICEAAFQKRGSDL